MAQLNLKYLLVAVSVLQQRQAQGMLLCCKLENVCEIHFRKGKIIHALNSKGLQGALCLYEVLNWTADETVLQWRAGNAQVLQTIDSEEEAEWLHTLKLLQERGLFVPFSTGQADPVAGKFFGETVPAKPAPVQVEKFILPPGVVSSGLTGPVAVGEFNSFLKRLRQKVFSGYVRCQGDFNQALLIFREGNLIHAGLVYRKELEPDTALEKLKPGGFNALAVEVRPDQSEAWRSLVSGANPYNDIAASTANYQKLLKSFAGSKHTGAIRLCLQQTELFALLHEGRLLGIFRPENKIGSPVYYLQETGNIPEKLLDHPGATLDVFLTTPAQPLRLPGDALTAEEIEYIAQALEAMIKLSSQLAAPEKVGAHLDGVIRRGLATFPVLKALPPVEFGENQLPALNLQKAHADLSENSREDTLSAFDYLFEEFLQDYCRPIGPAIFHSMAARAIDKEHAQKLTEIGLHLDFLEETPAPDQPVSGNTEQPSEANPYDF